MDGWPGVGGASGAEGVDRGERSGHLRLLAGRIGQCADEGDRIMAGLRQVQVLDWQSPAGRAYRNSLARHCDALWLAGHTLQAARAAVARHAEAVAEQESRGGVPWWS